MCRNAQKLYYPIEESIRSALPLVDEFVVVIGKGDDDDGTLEIVRGINSPKLRIVESDWDVVSFPNGTVHAQQTDLAKSQCTGDWLLYLQADELIHEEDIPVIRAHCEQYLEGNRIEGFLFQYLHFWGDYHHLVASHGWYPKEIRMIRNLDSIHSWESAQSFRVIPAFDGKSYRTKKGTRKLNVIELPCRIFHYGWVRPPERMTEKMNRLDQIHSHTEKRYLGPFDFGDPASCIRFQGEHPVAIKGRIAEMHWNPWIRPNGKRPKHKHEQWKNRVLTWIEKNILGGRQVFAFQNYNKLN